MQGAPGFYLSKNPGQKDTTMLLDCSPARKHDTRPPKGGLRSCVRYRIQLPARVLVFHPLSLLE